MQTCNTSKGEEQIDSLQYKKANPWPFYLHPRKELLPQNEANSFPILVPKFALLIDYNNLNYMDE